MTGKRIKLNMLAKMTGKRIKLARQEVTMLFYPSAGMDFYDNDLGSLLAV
jgi:hypothetical protein